MKTWMKSSAAFTAGCVLASVAASQTKSAAPDLGKDRTLYVVGYAHLDTQWRWTYPQTIHEFLAHTLHDNFALFEKHPNYVFNFTGARRYEMFKEYYPSEYQELKRYVAAGRWFPCGSSLDENDSNIPSAESLIRNVLYGNRFFRRELGTASNEYMLPDCFGFSAAVPSVLAHCGVKGFSTQKLTWGSVVGIPFKVGVWNGPDGRSVIAALDPGQYDGQVEENLANSETWKKRIEANGAQSGVFADFHYYGTGDVGGAPRESSVAMVEKSMATEGAQRVIAGPADALFKAITPAMEKRLPHYTGELELTEHSAGSATSEAYMKRWNRKNELLADEAERASVFATWLGAREYPSQKLENAWTLVVGSQMHDIVSGTALAKGYEYAWNDELLAANQFSAVLQDAVEVAASQMDTRGEGTSLVLFNPLAVEREDVVEVDVPGDASAVSVVVNGPDKKSVPAQILSAKADAVHIAFLAKVPSVGFAVFDAKLVASAASEESALSVDVKRLENERYVVSLNADGDVASIHDKLANRELLAAPARLELHYENPRNWPAWNQDWTDRQQPPREFVDGPANVRVVERGPARVAIEISRQCGNSSFVQRIRLGTGGAANRIEFDTDIGWSTRERSLRAAFPFSVKNSHATYDLQTGTLERGNFSPKQYEYDFQQWFDLTDAKGDYGASVMCDSKYGSDKPDDSTVRLTLLHTPGTRGGYQDQGTQDLGRHRVLYAISGHNGDWRQGRTAIEAARLNQPIVAFRVAAHDGKLGKSFALLSTSDANVAVTALKKAEDGDAIVVRLRELSGRDAKGVKISALAPIVAAREVDGQEREIAKATLANGALVADLHGYELRAFSVELGAPPVKVARPTSTSLALAYDTDVVSTNAKRADGAMDAQGRTLPAEQLPATLTVEDAVFTLGSSADGAKNALACRGQELALPASGGDRLELLAACDGAGKDLDATLEIDGKPFAIHVRDWTAKVGQWDHRLWQGDLPELAYGWQNGLGGIEPGYVKREPIAWFSSHHHTPTGDAYYQYCYLYKSVIELPKSAKRIRLPNDERIKLFAATVVGGSSERATPAAPLFDTLDDHVQDAPHISPSKGTLADAVDVRIEPGLYWKAGSIRYTVDGSAPTASSSVYKAPFSLNRPTTIRAAVVDAAGACGPEMSATLDIRDTTAPTVKEIVTSYASPILRVEFSEPVGDSAEETKHYGFAPKVAVSAAKRTDDGRGVVLTLGAPLAREQGYRLTIDGVSDASPAHNAMSSFATDVRVLGPVFEVDRPARTESYDKVPNLPVKAADPWTLNMFVRTDKQPDDRTVIAGFGRCGQNVDGGARYMAKFQNGLQFWSHNRDLEGRTPLELGRWQMLTATFDGKSLRLYKDGKQLGEREVQFADDESTVSIAPLDPWESKRRFDGEIRAFAIWREALGEDAIRSLLGEAPKN